MKRNNPKQSTNRRSFLRGSLATGAAVIGATTLGERRLSAAPPPKKGDIDILRFLAAAELIEADLWQQYAELGGLTAGQFPGETFPANAPFTPMNSYQAALMNLDSDGPQYISSNTLDEQSHAA